MCGNRRRARNPLLRDASVQLAAGAHRHGKNTLLVMHIRHHFCVGRPGSLCGRYVPRAASTMNGADINMVG
eukprot:scaffold34966_cov30-Tisochrysis_lutea.AAC.5